MDTTGQKLGRSTDPAEGGEARLEIECCQDHESDADFDHISAVTGQPTQWIVERGSID
jgi:hypothetical protein